MSGMTGIWTVRAWSWRLQLAGLRLVLGLFAAKRVEIVSAVPKSRCKRVGARGTLACRRAATKYLSDDPDKNGDGDEENHGQPEVVHVWSPFRKRSRSRSNRCFFLGSNDVSLWAILLPERADGKRPRV